MKFSLRTILVSILVFAVAFTIIGVYVDRCVMQAELVSWCREHGASVHFDDNSTMGFEPSGVLWKLIGRETYFPIGGINDFDIKNDVDADEFFESFSPLKRRRILVYANFSPIVSDEKIKKFDGIENFNISIREINQGVETSRLIMKNGKLLDYDEQKLFIIERTRPIQGQAERRDDNKLLNKE